MTAQSQRISTIEPNAEVIDTRWRSLYKAGGAAALAIGTLLIVEAVFYVATSAPSLTDALAWFRFFQTNRLVALIDFGILELYGLVLFVPMFLALYAALRRASENYTAIAVVLAVVGIAANFATIRLFPLLTLSDLYAAAATDALKSQFLAAGQAVLALGALGGIGGSAEGGIPLAVAGLIISVVMLRSRILGRGAGYVGLLTNGIALVMYINAAAAPASIGSPFFAPFLLLSVIWYALVGIKLLGLARASQPGDARQAR